MDGALDILIAGAGIGGLTAALGLRQQGHRVRIFEQSRFANEIGAALHVVPNCNGVLKRLGIDVEDIGANRLLGFTSKSMRQEIIQDVQLTGPVSDMWQHTWQLVHRVHLHQELKRRATDPRGKGTPVQLLTSSKVVSVDTDSGTVRLENGEEHKGDVTIGADGVHSALRNFLPGGDIKPFGSGKSAFRFLIPRKTLLEDPITAPFAEKEGWMNMWIGDDRRLVIYPCANNELLNLLVIHPSEESDARGDEWSQGGNKDKMLEISKEFDSDQRAIIAHADPQTLKVWELLDMDKLPTWVNGKLALLGDAAHPFLPHQAQGGAQAIEDGASLAIVLPRGTPKEEIPERLKLYEKCRYERAHTIQEFTRLVGMDMSEIAKRGKTLNIFEFVSYNFGYDEWDRSTQMLRKWEWARKPNLYWRMPTPFGPALGPRQDFLGRRHDGTKSTFTTASIRFKTSRTLLQNLFPSPAFKFASPATVCEASFSVSTLDKLDWLGGGGYSHAGLYIHGVQYMKKDGTTIQGTYLAVLFENLADPILTGREELGFPKLYCDIDTAREGSNLRIKLSWRGTQFGKLEWQELGTAPSVPSTGPEVNGDAAPHGPRTPPEQGLFTYKYVPAVGERGKADAEYAVLTPNDPGPEGVKPIVNSTQVAQNAKCTFEGRDWTSLPTLHHVAERLGEIPVYGLVEGKFVVGTGVSDVAGAVRIE